MITVITKIFGCILLIKMEGAFIDLGKICQVMTYQMLEQI